MVEERTFVMIKPDGYSRRLVGEIISRIERKGLKIVGLKLIKMSREQAEKLYAVHKNKPFYNDLVKFVTSGPVVVMVVKGESAVEVMRVLIGPTDGRRAPPGTIRGDFALSIQENIIHASDSVENAEYELSIFFSDNELVE
ncbi:MAG: nucleoside-diphosphate kinase [Sulfolobales archaeon]